MTRATQFLAKDSSTPAASYSNLTPPPLPPLVATHSQNIKTPVHCVAMQAFNTHI